MSVQLPSPPGGVFSCKPASMASSIQKCHEIVCESRIYWSLEAQGETRGMANWRNWWVTQNTQQPDLAVHLGRVITVWCNNRDLLHVKSGSNDCPIKDAKGQGRERSLGRSLHVCLSRVFTSVCWVKAGRFEPKLMRLSLANPEITWLTCSIKLKERSFTRIPHWKISVGRSFHQRHHLVLQIQHHATGIVYIGNIGATRQLALNCIRRALLTYDHILSMAGWNLYPPSWPPTKNQATQKPKYLATLEGIHNWQVHGKCKWRMPTWTVVPRVQLPKWKLYVFSWVWWKVISSKTK